MMMRNLWMFGVLAGISTAARAHSMRPAHTGGDLTLEKAKSMRSARVSREAMSGRWKVAGAQEVWASHHCS
ncbi:hypothetical protein DFH09DRAFT_1197741 [Mycena vulgaris]|nr:hypothetical protein DFH09DRAFT_1198262 [Mycena vulgaris]KAJ6511760.1 hypothetical protein DFH09DRAFT_1197741 [Mycena vulgaris]